MALVLLRRPNKMFCGKAAAANKYMHINYELITDLSSLASEIWTFWENLLNIEVQVTGELQLSSEDLLVDPERIVVKEWRVPAGR